MVAFMFEVFIFHALLAIRTFALNACCLKLGVYSLGNFYSFEVCHVITRVSNGVMLQISYQSFIDIISANHL